MYPFILPSLCLLFACDERIITGAISLVDDVNGGDGSSVLSSLLSFSLIHCNRPPPAAALFSIVSLLQIKHEAERDRMHGHELSPVPGVPLL